MAVEFAQAGRLTPEAARQRMQQTTAEQLAALTTDPAFGEWQARKAVRENRARVATNLLAVGACVALAVVMALLKPATSGPPDYVTPAFYPPEATYGEVPHSAKGLDDLMSAVAASAVVHDRKLNAPGAATGGHPMDAEEVQLVLEMAAARLATAQAEAEAAQDAAADLALRLHQAEETAAMAMLRAAEREADAEQAEATAAEQTAQAVVEVEELRRKLAAAEAAAERAASLAEATASVAGALFDAHQPAASMEQPAPPAEEEFADLVAAPLAGDAPYALPSMGAALALLGRTTTPPLTPTTIAIGTLAAAAATALVAAAVLAARGRRRVAAEAARAAALAARLKEAAYAKDAAEQSLGMLEREVQALTKQLEDAQAAVADASSPKIGTAPMPPLPGLGTPRTPGACELPPPPASLVEKFLRDHNFLAVKQEQMTEWLEMEGQFGEMQAALGELQAALAEKDEQIQAFEQDLSSANEHTSLELRTREDQLLQVRTWLDEAQEELLETQAALQEREAECRRVGMQLEAMRAVTADAQGSASDAEGHDEALRRQNLELVSQLQAVTAAYEAMREQLVATAGAINRPGSPVRMLAAFNRPASAASTLPGTPADLGREVQSCLEMMRATRAQLADRLAHSQGVCEAMIADCRQGSAAGADQGDEPAKAPSTAGALLAAADNAAAAMDAPFGSPAAPSPLPGGVVETNPLFEAESSGEGWEGEEMALLGAAPSPAVLGISQRHNVAASTSTSKATSSHMSGASAGDCTPTSDAEGSMRNAWSAARGRVAEVRARHNGWDLAGFVRDLGFEIEEEEAAAEDAAAVGRVEFEVLRGRAEEVLAAAAACADTSPERALAGEAMAVVREWQFPAQRINTPPPSPFWRLLGLQA